MNQDDSVNAGQGDKGSGNGPGKDGPGKGGDDKFQIRIDRTEYKVRQAVLTGAEIRKIPDPDIGRDRDLFEVVPGGSDLKIELTTEVKMRDGLRFFTAPAQINPGA
jgi:hypothetical protein